MGQTVAGVSIAARIVTNHQGLMESRAFQYISNALQYWEKKQSSMYSAVLFVLEPSDGTWQPMKEYGSANYLRAIYEWHDYQWKTWHRSKAHSREYAGDFDGEDGAGALSCITGGERTMFDQYGQDPFGSYGNRNQYGYGNPYERSERPGVC
mmetsp:Transcript_56579/g.127936  ORF Transcript_56579/g.127936 Transcript_56579/m.127936 type:complete len:152 (+) Transcript_56579:99-554(+)